LELMEIWSTTTNILPINRNKPTCIRRANPTNNPTNSNMNNRPNRPGPLQRHSTQPNKVSPHGWASIVSIQEPCEAFLNNQQHLPEPPPPTMHDKIDPERRPGEIPCQEANHP
jgi:hypothetical protein